jgi:hypothetical protein
MTDDKIRFISSLVIVTGIGLMLVILSAIKFGLGPENTSGSYEIYIKSLYFPMGMLSILLIICGVVLFKDVNKGKILLLLSSGGLMLFGISSISYNLLNGVYTASSLDLLLNGVANAWCIGLGLITTIFATKKL